MAIKKGFLLRGFLESKSFFLRGDLFWPFFVLLSLFKHGMTGTKGQVLIFFFIFGNNESAFSSHPTARQQRWKLSPWAENRFSIFARRAPWKKWGEPWQMGLMSMKEGCSKRRVWCWRSLMQRSLWSLCCSSNLVSRSTPRALMVGRFFTMQLLTETQKQEEK